MKIFLKCFFAIFATSVVLVLLIFFLSPVVYRIIEPRFAMPIRTPDKNFVAVEDLPVRHDSYGDGEFGAKRRGNRKHKGLDLAAGIKSPVYASKSGWARSYAIPAGYGNLVIINHPGGWQTRYGHLHESVIKKFQWVGQGDIIGSVGRSG